MKKKKRISEKFLLMPCGKERESLFSKHCKALDQKRLSVLHFRKKKKGKGRKGKREPVGSSAISYS